MPERTAPAPSRGGRVAGVFTEKIGPLPMWAWVAIIAVALIGWRLYSGKKNSSSDAASSTSADSTAADTVPQFVNQTYTTVTPPVQGTPGPPGPQGTPGPSGPQGFGPKPAQLTRTWTSLGGSTYAQVAQRLLGS